MKAEAEKLLRLVSRLEHLALCCEEASKKQFERAELQQETALESGFLFEASNTGLGYVLTGEGQAYQDVAKSIRSILNGEESVFHLSAEADYLYEDPEDL